MSGRLELLGFPSFLLALDPQPMRYHFIRYQTDLGHFKFCKFVVFRILLFAPRSSFSFRDIMVLRISNHITEQYTCRFRQVAVETSSIFCLFRRRTLMATFFKAAMIAA